MCSLAAGGHPEAPACGDTSVELWRGAQLNVQRIPCQTRLYLAAWGMHALKGTCL